MPLTRAGRALLALALAACSGSSEAPDRTPSPEAGAGGAPEGARAGGAGAAGSPAGGSGGFQVTGPATFGEVKSVFAARCVACHRGTNPALVDLRDGAELYARLTTPLTTPSCNGRVMVVPGSLAESLLPAKVQPRPPCGTRMPSECSLEGCLSAAEIQTIVDWVGSGAPEQ